MAYDNLSAYYTPRIVADFLVSKIPLKNVKRILDLCVGSGNLLAAARWKWLSALLVGVDIDASAVAKCSNRFLKHALFFQGDARLLDPMSTTDYPELNMDSFDVVLANPPFSQNGRDKSLALIPPRFNSSHFITNWTTLFRRIEAQLLVYNTLYVRDGGYLAAIVPNSILSCDRFSSLRSWLIAQSEFIKVIKLPEKTFHKSQVLSSAIILKRKIKPHPSDSINFILQEAEFRSGVLMSKTLYKGKIGKKKNKNTRLDLIHQSTRQGMRFQKLNRFTSIIKRGIFVPKSSLGVTGSCYYFHSTNIKDDGFVLDNKQRHVTDTKVMNAGVYVQPGDILVVRVGKTLGKVGVVPSSDNLGLISSCLFLIRSKGLAPYSLALLLQCKISQEYFHTRARGSAARFLTYEDVRETPVPHIPSNTLVEFAKEYEALLKLPIDHDADKQRRAKNIRKLLNAIESIIES